MLLLLFSNTGPSLPFGLFDSAMAKSPDGRGVLLFGGCTNAGCVVDGIDDRILELRAEANSWNILNITLEYRRNGHVAIPLK